MAKKKAVVIDSTGVEATLASTDYLDMNNAVASNEIFALKHQRTRVLSQINVYLDIVNGIDDLDPTDYLGATASTGNRFLTFRKCFDWVNQIKNGIVNIYLQNMPVGSPLIINGTFSFFGKTEVSFFSSGGTAYINITLGNIVSENSNIYFSGINFNCTKTDSFNCYTRGSMQFAGCSITMGNAITSLFNVSISHSILFTGTNTINFGANNQLLFNSTGNGGGRIYFDNQTSNFTVVDGGFTGLRWSKTNTVSIETWFPASNGGVNTVTIPSSINMIDTVLYYGTSQALRQAVYQPTSINYAQVLGNGQNPLKFESLVSTSSDGTYSTRKGLFVNENGVVIVGNGTGGTSNLGFINMARLGATL